METSFNSRNLQIFTNQTNMSGSSFIYLLVGILLSSSVKAECESGWTPFKDETCIKAFTDLLTYDEAKYFCGSQSSSLSTATMVNVKEEELQVLLAQYTKDKYENFWLGGRYDNSSGQFKWEDGDLLTYTNWAEGYPRNITTSEYCIQSRPVNAKTVADLDGKWEDAVCQRRNLAMCERSLPWSLEDATREIQKLRKELEAVSSGFAQALETVKAELDVVNSRVVPVGSIYIEYFNQSSPVTLWPALSWQEVTESYANLFFRAYGNESEEWGVNQKECAPRISQMQYTTTQNGAYVNPLTIPSGGWSDYGWTGEVFAAGGTGVRWYEGVRYNTDGCKVRPNNQAIRIWKRLAYTPVFVRSFQLNCTIPVEIY